MSQDLANLVRERLEVEQALSVHAASSARFREALRENPVAAVQTLLGGDADLGDIDVEVVEMPVARLRVSVPTVQTGELEEEELAAVAGGATATSQDLDEVSQFDLQQAVQAQSRTIQTLSSIMKAQHETMKSIIQNMKA